VLAPSLDLLVIGKSQYCLMFYVLISSAERAALSR
jgi:hypothetical protein